MTALAPDRGALRTRLDEHAWAAAVLAAGDVALPDWAVPHPGERVPAGDVAAGDAPDGGPGAADAVGLRSRAVLAVDVATTSGTGGLLAEVATDLASVVGIARRVVVPAAPSVGVRVLRGVELSVAPVRRLVDEVVRLFPPVPSPEHLEAVEVAEEHTVAFGRALRTGDAATVDAICAEHGWGAVPEVLRALVQEQLGSATVTIRRHGTGPRVGRWVLTRRGWVELARTRDETVRHRPRSRADIARELVTALGTAASAAIATSVADRHAGTEEGTDRE